MKYCLFLSLLLFTACKREQFQSKDPITMDLLNHYGLIETQADIPRLKNILASLPLYLKIGSRLDFSKVESYYSPRDNSNVYIIGFIGTPDKRYAVRTSYSGKEHVTHEILYSRKKVDENTGEIGILKNQDALKISFRNGTSTITELPIKEFNIQFARDPFCQRKPGQSFKDCYNHEVDEFCDSFISCVALSTNPTVSILIAVACSCYPD